MRTLPGVPTQRTNNFGVFFSQKNFQSIVRQFILNKVQGVKKSPCNMIWCQCLFLRTRNARILRDQQQGGNKCYLSKFLILNYILLLSSWGYVTQLLDGACPLVGCNLNIMVIFLDLHISNFQ